MLESRHRASFWKYTEARGLEGTVVHFRQTSRPREQQMLMVNQDRSEPGRYSGAKDYPEVRSFLLRNDDTQ